MTKDFRHPGGSTQNCKVLGPRDKGLGFRETLNPKPFSKQVALPLATRKRRSPSSYLTCGHFRL